MSRQNWRLFLIFLCMIGVLLCDWSVVTGLPYPIGMIFAFPFALIGVKTANQYDRLRRLGESNVR